MRKMYKLSSSLFAVFLTATLFAQDAAHGPTAIGGDYDESTEEEFFGSEDEAEDFADSASDLSWDINDSLRFIPAYDLYCNWDTRNIHAYGYDLTKMRDSARIVLRHDNCDYHLPHQGHVTSNFGERGSRYHYGIDIKLEKGDPVHSCFEGVVRISQYSKTYGHVVVVRHNNGLETLYAHLSKREAEVGDHVEAGELIGLGGNTGRSTGPHLHFECRYKGEPIDPNELIDWESGDLQASTLTISAASFEYLKAARSKKYHSVRSGDTLSGISRRYGVSVGTLCRLNGISQKSIIRIGQKLRYR